jgi:transposase-like protein
MKKQGILATGGRYCPNQGCRSYQEVDAGNIIGYGKSRQGRQRYQCKVCKRVFNEQVGSIFYRKQTPAKDIIEALAMLAEGMGVRATARVKGIKPDTLLAWLGEASAHARQVEQVLLQDYELSASQIDALWTYVGRKGEKKAAKRAASIGVVA